MKWQRSSFRLVIEQLEERNAAGKVLDLTSLPIMGLSSINNYDAPPPI